MHSKDNGLSLLVSGGDHEQDIKAVVENCAKNLQESGVFTTHKLSRDLFTRTLSETLVNNLMTGPETIGLAIKYTLAVCMENRVPQQ
jgi:hypothetical protein